MKIAAKSAYAVTLATTLALALAACGGDVEQADGPAQGPDAAATAALTEGMETPAAATTPTPGATPSPGVSPTASASASASATPTPTPSASATRASATPTPSATPTRVAAAGPPPAFAQCSACHAVAPGRHGIGPSLAGVFGKRAASQAGYDYSEALEGSGLTWNQAGLNRFLADPMGVVPGTKMAYPGLKDAAQRQAVIDYLRTL